MNYSLQEQKRLNVGVIGLGVGLKHVSAYEAHPFCKVVALCDLSETKLAAASPAHPDALLTADSFEIINDPAIDVVSIASYDDDHYKQVIASLGKGKHVFVEKPLCLFRNEAIRIKKCLQDRPHLKLSSNLNLRASPHFIRIKEAIDSGAFGELFYIEGDYLWGRIHKLHKGWRGDMAFYSIVHGAAVHMIDLILWLTGMKPVEVNGMGNNICSRDTSFRFRDFTTLLLRFENGMVAKISASAGCIHPHFHSVNIYGTKRTFTQNISGASLIGKKGDDIRVETQSDHYTGNQKGEVISSFVDAILTPNHRPIVPADDVFNVMSVCFAAEKALDKGKPVSINYI